MVRPYFSPASLARYKALDERDMPDSCTITHVTSGTVVPGSDGTETTGDVTTSTTVICRLESGAAATETLIAMRLTEVASGVFSLPLGTAVSVKDRITKGGVTWEVLGTDAGRSYATSLAVAVREIQ